MRFFDNTYIYDNLDRIVRENNKNLDKTYTWIYNEGGNIVTKNEYVYSEGELGAVTKTYSYSCGKKKIFCLISNNYKRTPFGVLFLFLSFAFCK